MEGRSDSGLVPPPSALWPGPAGPLAPEGQPPPQCLNAEPAGVLSIDRDNVTFPAFHSLTLGLRLP
jgi:hypothetical protein